MALEDLTGPLVFIDALDSVNPTGSDGKNEGDDHVRGVKNVLLNSFAFITGPLTASHTELNGFFATGNKMVFFQAAAPVGWTQDTTSAADNKMLRIVNTAGGGSAGTDSPITHTHTTASLALTISQIPAHTHTYDRFSLPAGPFVQGGGGTQPISTSTASGSIGGDGSHNHGLTGAYNPKYVDMILCSKD